MIFLLERNDSVTVYYIIIYAVESMFPSFILLDLPAPLFYMCAAKKYCL